MTIFNSAPKSICVLRLSAIGDLCHAIACVQSIQRQWPTTKITWITGKAEAQLLKFIDNITIITFDKKNGLKEYLHIKKILKGQHFDALLHMQSAIRASIISLMINSPIKIGFDFERAKDLQWLFTNKKIDPSRSVHVLDGFMAFAKKLGVNDQSVQWDLNIPKDALIKAKRIIKEKPTVIICPAASKAYKNWIIEGYVAIAEHAIQKGFQVLICGAPTKLEIELGDEITFQTKKKVINLIGETSLIELIALIKYADLLIAPDTGPIHMATMVNTTVIGLYAHHNPKRTGPYTQLNHTVSVYEELITKQTGKAIEELPWRTRVLDKNAMREITISSVKKMFDKITHKREQI